MAAACRTVNGPYGGYFKQQLLDAHRGLREPLSNAQRSKEQCKELSVSYNHAAHMALMPRINQTFVLFNNVYEGMCRSPVEVEALNSIDTMIAAIQQKAAAAGVELRQKSSSMAAAAIVPSAGPTH